MKVMTTVTVCAVLAIRAPAVLAQTPAHDPTRFVSPDGRAIEDLVKHALDKEPGLQALRHLVEAARARVEQAALRPNPSLSVSRREEAGGTDNQTMADFEWPLDLWRRTARVDAARAATAVSEIEAADRARLLASEVRSAAGALLAAERHLRVAAALVDTMRRFADLVRARAEEGAVPRLDYDLALVDVHRLEVEHALAESRAEEAALTLKRRLGLPPDAPLTLRLPLEESAAAPIETTIARPPEERADVRAADARVAEAGARAALARAEGRLDADVFVSYQRMDSGFPQRGFDDTGVLARVRGVFHNVAGGVRLTLPMRNQNQGEVRAIEAERAAAEAERSRVTLTAAGELASARVADAAARRAVVSFQQVRELAARNLAVVREAYELGRTALNDVLLEQRRFLGIEMELTDLLSQQFEAGVTLERARGRLP